MKLFLFLSAASSHCRGCITEGIGDSKAWRSDSQEKSWLALSSGVLICWPRSLGSLFHRGNDISGFATKFGVTLFKVPNLSLNFRGWFGLRCVHNHHRVDFVSSKINAF